MSGVGRRVLLTGGNGFIGSHILDQLLDAGFHVRAVVRSQAKAESLKRDHPKARQNLDTAVVEDITIPGAFDSVLQTQPPLDTVIHTASPFLYSVAKDARDFLDPAIKGTTELLKSVKKTAPGVKRVIITSSFAAIGGFGQIDDAGKTYTAADWNPARWEDALATKETNFAYRASKKFAEKAAWEFVEREKPAFDLVVLNPPMVYGPLRHTISNVSELNESNLRIWRLFIDSTKDAELPPNGLPLYVDVRDIAHAHVAAALTPAAGGKRFLVTPGNASSQEIADLLRANIPELAERTPIGEPGGNPLPSTAFTADSSPVQQILGVTFRSKESTFVELAKQLLQIESAQRK